MLRFLSAAVLLLLASCAQLPPTAADIEAKKFQEVPGKAVIYIVRTALDSKEASGLWLDDSAQITTLPGTYYRWEVTPGSHRVVGYGPANEAVALATVAGRIYFLEHTVRGTIRTGVLSTALRQINEREGRALVTRSQLL